MLGVINFANGTLFTLGGYVAYWVKDVLGLPGALVAAPVLVGLLGILTEATFLRRLYVEDPLQACCSRSGWPSSGSKRSASRGAELCIRLLGRSGSRPITSRWS